MSDETYGGPRIRAQLADVDGRKVGVRERAPCGGRGSQAFPGRRFCVTTPRDGAPVSPDLVERRFEADAPNRV